MSRSECRTVLARRSACYIRGSEGTRVLRRQAWVPRDGPQSNLGPDVPCLHPVVFGSVVFGSVPSLVLTILFSESVSVFNPFLCRARFRATHTALAP